MTTRKIPVVIEGTGGVVYLPDDTIVDATFSTMPLGEVPREMCTDGGMKLALPDRQVGRVEGYEDEIERLHKERDALVARLEAEAKRAGHPCDPDLAEAIDGLDRLDVYALAMRKAVRIVRGEP